MTKFSVSRALRRAMFAWVLLSLAPGALAERYSFIYTYTGDRAGQPLNDGSILTGEIEGHLDPGDPTGDTVIIDSFIWVSLRGIPYASITNDEIDTNPPGGTPSMTFSGAGPNMNFQSCPSGFTIPPEDPSDCNFGDEGGFAVFTNQFTGDLVSFSGVRGEGRAGRATNAPFVSANWHLTPSTYTNVATLMAEDGTPDNYLGTGVSISGDTAAVGAYRDNEKGNNAGAVYIFVRNKAGNWSQQAKLVAADGGENAFFGRHVALSGNTVFVGVTSDAHNGNLVGAAYVFERTGGTWDSGYKLLRPASEGEDNDRFGRAVALDQNTAVVTSFNHPRSTARTGAAYVYTRNTGGGPCPQTGTSDPWCQSAKLTASDALPNDRFGIDASLYRSTLVIGAYGFNGNAGAAYVFTGSGSNWTQEAKLLPEPLAETRNPGDWFGIRVDAGRDFVLVGAPRESGNGATSGAAYIFERNTTNQVCDVSGTVDGWCQHARLIPDDITAGDAVGWGLGISGNTAVVTAEGADDLGNEAGKAYLFTRSGNNWVQSQEFFAPNAGADDWFGVDAGLRGDDLIIGAPTTLASDQGRPGYASVFRINRPVPAGTTQTFDNVEEGWYSACRATNCLFNGWLSYGTTRGVVVDELNGSNVLLFNTLFDDGFNVFPIGFHFFNRDMRSTSDTNFFGNYHAGIKKIRFDARHSGLGDGSNVILRAILFDTFDDTVNSRDWAISESAQTIAFTDTTWNTYEIPIRARNMVPGFGNAGDPPRRTAAEILSAVSHVGLRHSPTTAGPGNPDFIDATVYFDNIQLIKDSDTDGDGIGDLSDPCPSDPLNQCDPLSSAAETIDPASGGTVSTPDGNATISVPPGALASAGETTITANNSATGIQLSDLGEGIAIYGLEIGPPGTVFDVPIQITFAWPDADNDGVVDGSTLQESALQVTKDGVAITGKCQDEPVGAPLADCDSVANTFSFEVSSLSVFNIVGPNDTDQDGVADNFAGEVDACPGTAIPESTPTDGLKENRYVLLDEDFIFDTIFDDESSSDDGSESSDDPVPVFTTLDTAGCSCEQIIQALGVDPDKARNGCKRKLIEEWIDGLGH